MVAANEVKKSGEVQVQGLIRFFDVPDELLDKLSASERLKHLRVGPILLGIIFFALGSTGFVLKIMEHLK